MNTSPINPALLRNLSPEEFERHLYMTQPYSPAHLAAIASHDAQGDLADAEADAEDADHAYQAEKKRRIDAEDAITAVEVALNEANTENQDIAAELTRQGGRIIRLERLLSQHQIQFLDIAQ